MNVNVCFEFCDDEVSEVLEVDDETGFGVVLMSLFVVISIEDGVMDGDLGSILGPVVVEGGVEAARLRSDGGWLRIWLMSMIW